MPNKVTGGTAVAGGFKSGDDGTAKFGSGKILYQKSNTVARTDTTAKSLFVIPALAEIVEIIISGNTASNAGTTAVLDIGKTGSNSFFVNDYSLLTASGLGVHVPAAVNMGSVGATDITVNATYAETGTASTTGGPWTVTVVYSIETKIV